MATSLRFLLLAAIFTTCSASIFGQDSEIGWANYYSDYYQGRATAYGEVYDRAQLSCAHKSYPAGTLLRVTRMDTRRSVIVRVNDKGPLAEGFLVTLSLEGALSLGMEQTGKARVLVEPVGFAQTPQQPVTASSYSRYETPQEFYNPDLTPRGVGTNPYPLNRTALLPKNNSPAPYTETVVQSPYSTYPINNPYTSGNNYQNTPATSSYPPSSVPSGYEYPVTPAVSTELAARSPLSATTVRTSGFGIQLGAYSSKENAERQAQSIQSLGVGEVFVVPGVSNNNAVVYRVVAGASGTRTEAEAYRRQLLAQFRLSGFIVEF